MLGPCYPPCSPFEICECFFLFQLQKVIFILPITRSPWRVAQLFTEVCVVSGNGIVDVPSAFSVGETIDRLESLLRAKGIKIFARIDQKAEARAVGLSMRDTQLLIFGDPRAGTPLMLQYPSIAVDLPAKALAWESADGKVWLSYNSPEYLKDRHNTDSPPLLALTAIMVEATQ